jgi:hypothetical protein
MTENFLWCKRMPFLLLNLGLAGFFKCHTKHLLSDVCGVATKNHHKLVVVLPTLEGARITDDTGVSME